ncbi:MAG: D-glycero-beta-D-manno-heptose 1-phosphate adenylyltransferase [Candidatus Aminicenantes bacterium]|nr:D-glycero-beta-D-manno-heptose 1-phosphate adenylyltransferase [Acidobacteriota bacterium]MCG2810479.1 D-glycero-beta-D-manno-heptose 1-phosphate adenylyltransferase [Candidatus Aminicenantes bacterium]
MKIRESGAALRHELPGRPEEKIVFTNGVFDLLHPGHIQLLQYAREQGDILIVGINDDESVRRLKGEKRPIFPLSERMEILAALECVDFVVPFSEDTPLQLIQALGNIDVLVKGGDYAPGQVVGRKEVEGRGGKLCLFKLAEKYSTSALIDKIVKNF